MSEKYVTHDELDQFRREVRDRLREMFGIVQGLKASPYMDTEDQPGLPPRMGKGFYGARYDLRCRVDKVLSDLLIEHARRDYSGNISRALSVVLWRFYGRPALSWERDEDSAGAFLEALADRSMTSILGEIDDERSNEDDTAAD